MRRMRKTRVLARILSASKRSCGAMAVAILVAAGIVASATTASATTATATNNDIETFQNVHTNRCLDDSGDDSHDVLRGFPCNGLDFQKWIVHVQADGTRELRNVHTNRCLDDSG